MPGSLESVGRSDRRESWGRKLRSIIYSRCTPDDLFRSCLLHPPSLIFHLALTMIILNDDDDDVSSSSTSTKSTAQEAQNANGPPPPVPARSRTPPPPYSDAPDYASVLPSLAQHPNSLDNSWNIVHATPPSHLHQSSYANSTSTSRRRLLEKRAAEPMSKRFIKTFLIALLLIGIALSGWCVTSIRVRSYPDVRGMGHPGQRQVSTHLPKP